MSDSTIGQVTIFDSPRFKVVKEPNAHLAIVIFNGQPTSEIYQKGINSLIDETKQHGINQWLIHCKDGCDLTADDQFWTIKLLAPKVAKELNLKKIAVIESKSLQDRLNLITLAERLNIESQIDIQFFELEHNARNWLELGCDFDI